MKTLVNKTTEKKTEGRKSEVVEGITFYEELQDMQHIPEVFGMDTDKYIEVVHQMYHFMVAGLRDHTTDSRVEMFKEFLQSERFKKLEIHFTTPGEYLVLGMAWGIIIKKLDGEEEDIPAFMKAKGIPITGEMARKLLDLLGDL